MTSSLFYYHDEQVGVRPCENRDVHRNAERVRLVETHPKVPLSAQQQEDEDTDVHQADTSCETHTHTHTMCSTWRLYFLLTADWLPLTLIGSGFVQVEEDGDQDVQHIAAL